MKSKMILVKTLCLSVGLCLGMTAQAQRINDPKHIPNQFQNKINNVRLKGLTQRASTNNQVNKELNKGGILDRSRFGFSGGTSVLGGSDCNVNVGNSSRGGVGSLSNRNTIIAGDVINVCK